MEDVIHSAGKKIKVERGVWPREDGRHILWGTVLCLCSPHSPPQRGRVLSQVGPRTEPRKPTQPGSATPRTQYQGPPELTSAGSALPRGGNRAHRTVSASLPGLTSLPSAAPPAQCGVSGPSHDAFAPHPSPTTHSSGGRRTF